MGEQEQTKAGPGRPENKTPPKEITISNMDALTFRMLGDLTEYGRLGRTRPEIALFIIRHWLWENEEKLKAGIASSDRPFGRIFSDTE
jgi:hypothetical protein